MAPPSKWTKIAKNKQNETENLQRSQTQRQNKSIYRRNNLDIHVVNNEDSNQNNEGSHINEQLQSIPPCIPTLDYTLLARESIKQQGLINSNNSSALNDSHNTTAETQSTSFQSVENVDNNVDNTETVTLLPPLRSDLLIGERNPRVIPPMQPSSTCMPSDVSSVANVNRGHVSMPGPQERQSNKDGNPLFNIVDQIFNAEPAVTATSDTELCHGPILGSVLFLLLNRG